MQSRVHQLTVRRQQISRRLETKYCLPLMVLTITGIVAAATCRKSLVAVSLYEQGATVPTCDNELAKSQMIVVNSCLSRGSVMSFRCLTSSTKTAAFSKSTRRKAVQLLGNFVKNVTLLYAPLPLWSKLEQRHLCNSDSTSWTQY